MNDEHPDNYFEEAFFNAPEYVKSIHGKLSEVMETLKSEFPELITFIIYGEYFGGYWPGV